MVLISLYVVAVESRNHDIGKNVEADFKPATYYLKTQ